MSVNIDADQRNADWIKTLSWEYPTQMDRFLMYIGGVESLEHFLTLPVAEQMPDALRAELAAGGSKHLPGQHDQLDHGRRGGAVPEKGGFHEGEQVMLRGGKLGTIVRIDDEGAHVEVRGVVGPEFSEDLQGKPTVDTYVIHMDFVGPVELMNHADVIDVDDGSGRTYAVTYSNAARDWMGSMGMYGQRAESYFEHATDQLTAMIDRNHELEADTGLTNPWTGEMHLGVDVGSQQVGAVGSKDWGCSIAFDLDYMRRVESGAIDANAEVPPPVPPTTDVSPEEAAMVYSHELAHGLSAATVPEIYEPQIYGNRSFEAFSQSDAYRRDPGFEEGIVQGYVEAKAQVEQYGPDGKAFHDDVSGSGAYHTWVLGLDEGLRISKEPETTGSSEMFHVVTTQERLDYYRDLLKTPLPERQKRIDELIAPSNYKLDLTGKGLGSKMGYDLRLTDQPPPPKSRPQQTSVHDLIFTAETPQDAREILPIVETYLATDPEDYLEIARDAEALVMLATSDLTLPVAEAMPDSLRVELGLAHNPKGLKFDEHLHPRYPAGTPGGLGGQFMPEGDAVAEGGGSPGDQMRARAERVGRGIHPGDPVHFISRNDGRYYHGTVTRIDGQGVHVNIPKQYGEHTSGNDDSIKEPEQIRHEADPIEIPPEAPTYTLANGNVIVGPWDPQFPDQARNATLILNPDQWKIPKVRALTASEARIAIREDKATAPPFVEGERVVATTGDIGTLQRIGGPRDRRPAEITITVDDGSAPEYVGETASILLDDGRVLADMAKGLQHAGTWNTPPGWEAAGIRDEEAHEIFSAQDGSGRVYGITYPPEWDSDVNTVAGLREALVMMIDNNDALEQDTGLTNAWNGTLNFEVHQRPGVAGTKEWSCSISIGQSVVVGMPAVNESDRAWNAAHNPHRLENSRSVLVHELAHGLSDCGTEPYRSSPGWEEGVVEAYAQSYMAVEKFGRSEPVTTTAPGILSYSRWVDGLDKAMHYAGRGDTYGDRLDYYRELLKMWPNTREAAVNQQMEAAGRDYRLELHGDTWNRREWQEAVFLDAGKSAGGEEAIRKQIFAARTVKEAEAALDAFEAYATAHPDTSMELRMDAEWLVMFTTAHTESRPGRGEKGWDPALHPRDAEGQWSETADERLMVESGPMAGVKFTIGTLPEEDQKTVHETLDRLGAKYPAGASMITAVQARPLKRVWGQMSDRGEMRLTNLGRKYEDMHDPALAETVTHEFGHAMFRNMAGITEPNKAPEGRPPSFNRQLDAGVPVSVIRESIRQWNDVMAEYNAMVQEQQDRVDALVTDMHRKIRDELGHDPDRIQGQLVAEFAGGPGYVATGDGPITYSDYLKGKPEELLAQAFSHYENGKHGVIADIVGHAIEEHYGVTS